MNDQARNLRKRMETSRNDKKARTIAVISGKGGVGKSNIALNFSLELVNRKKRTILFDLDIGMGNINILLGLQPKRTIVDLFNDRLSIFDIIEEGPGNLHYIAGGSGLNNFVQLSDRTKEHFYEQYQKLENMYDYIIFDMGAGINEDSLSFILAADECIVVTTGEPTSFTDAYSIIKQIVSHGGNMPLFAIINRAKSNNDLTTLKRFQQVVKQFLNINIQPLGIIPDDKHVNEAVMRQIPYLLLDKRAPAAKSIQQLADNYLNSLEEIHLSYKPAFIERLKSIIRGKF